MNPFRRRQTLLLGFLVLIGSGHVAAEESGHWEIIVCNPLLRSLEMESTWDAAKAIGVEALEIAVDSGLKCSRLYVGEKTPYSLESKEDAAKVAEAAREHELRTPVICASLRIAPEGDNKDVIDRAKRLIDTAPVIGCRLIYFPVAIRQSDTPLTNDLFIKQSVQLLREIGSYGKEKGVTVTIENLQRYWNRPEILAGVFEQVPEDCLGWTLDPTNLYWFGFPRARIYEIIDRFAPRVRYFHAKNVDYPDDIQDKQRDPGYEYIKYSVSVREGDLDFKKILTRVHQAGYVGYIGIEDDSLSHHDREGRVAVLRDDVQYLRSIVAELGK